MTFPIEIDAHQLSHLQFMIPGVTAEWTDRQTVQSWEMSEGIHTFTCGSGQSLEFTVTADGKVEYDAVYDQCVLGGGTTKLKLLGYRIQIQGDAQLSTPEIIYPYIIPSWVKTTALQTFWLLPGSYNLQVAAGYATVGYRVTLEGNIDYDEALGCFAGLGTTRLELVGFAIVVNPTALSHPQFLIPYVTASGTTTETVVPFQLLPGAYTFQISAGPECTFTVTPHGTIAYDSANDGFLAGRDSATLTLVGYIISIDAGSFEKTAIQIDPVGLLTVIAKPDPDSLTLLPYANYTLRLLPDPPKQAVCAVGQDGTVQLIGGDAFLALDSQGNRPVIRFIETPEAGTALATLADPAISGYLSGAALAKQFPGMNTAGQYWMRSGIAGFADDAKDHFYLPERYTDPFGNVTTLEYDDLDLFIQSSTDARGNRTSVEQFDYRVLAPRAMVDINGNHTETHVDILGMVVATAVKGKGSEADHLTGFDDDLANPPAADVQKFCTASEMDVQQASDWLKQATGRFVYHFGEARDATGKVTAWATRPAGACGIMRERHAAAPGGTNSPLQVALECSDGSGNVLMKKAQAEPEHEGGPLRWIINGLTVLNNKGKPVKQYEPSFSKQGFGCEMPPEEGVTPIMYYDAAGRVIRTEMPDGSYSRVEFSPWHVKTFDANDTAYDPDPVNPNHSDWYRRRTDPTHPLYATFDTPEDHRAAALIKAHANTPAQVHLDSLGREVIAIAHNRTNGLDEKYLTFTKLDAEGKPLWICDARGNLVMQYITPPKSNHTPLYDDPNPDWKPAYDMPSNAVPCYDIAGNLLFQHSMDAGDRWMLMDAADKPMLAWDMNETPQGTATTREDRVYITDYDALHRPTAQWLKTNNGPRVMVERYEYQDAVPIDLKNLNGQLIRHYDPSGLIETIRRDFKGNVQEVHRTLNHAPDQPVIDWQTNPASQLDSETHVQITEHDALNRMTRLYNWHRPADNRVAIYLPRYNKRGVLLSEELVMRATGYDPTTGTHTTAIQKILYNAKGQKTYLQLGNGTLTQYDYDPLTFRLRQLRTTRPANADEFPQRRSNLTNPNIIQQLLYTYDPVGNITEVEDQAYKPVFFDNRIAEPKSLYEYDALYRLIQATGRENGTTGGAPSHIEGNASETDFPITDPKALRLYTQIYTYDQVGNIKRMAHQAGSTGSWTRDYAYALEDPTQPASNRLWQTWTGGDRTEAITYGYDTHGNMLNLARTDPRFDLQWDHRDMINGINLGGGGTAFYQYDSGKQRTRKRIVNKNNTGYWERVYLGGYERYRRYNGSSTTPVEEIESHHLFEGKQRVLLVDDVIVTNKTHADGRAYKTGPIYRYQYSNHLGSACLELDDEAAIISYEEYHPYGTSAYRAMKRDSEAPAKRYRYTGMERDEESGLSYHSARYYLQWLGRWVSFDAGVGAPGLNRYLAFYNAPIVHTDSDGKTPQLIVNGTPTPPVFPNPTPPIINPSSGAGAVATGPQLPAGGGAVATGPQVSAGVAAESLTTAELAVAGGSIGVYALGIALLAAVVLIPVGIAIAGAHDIQTRTSRYEAEAKIGHEIYLKSLSPADQFFLSTEDKAILASEKPMEKVILPGARPSDEKATLPGARPSDEKAIFPGAREGEVAQLPGVQDSEARAELAPLTGLTKQQLHELYLAELKKFGEKNVKILPSGDVIHRHHLLPQEFREKFEAIGLDIEKFTVWLKESVHLNQYHGGAENGGLWNETWKEFFEKNPNARASDILEQLDKMNQQWQTPKYAL